MARKKTGNIYITIKLPEGTVKKIDEIIQKSDGDFTSRTDVIKTAIRDMYYRN
ncbi:MAG: ribbon-helix-helix domain-containing protein [Candidatus Woesearchaeota archaeon]